jgi:hypothetical protein
MVRLLGTTALMGQNICKDSAILRNEPFAAPDDSGGWARNAEEGAPGSEATAPGARWTSQRQLGQAGGEYREWRKRGERPRRHGQWGE